VHIDSVNVKELGESGDKPVSPGCRGGRI